MLSGENIETLHSLSAFTAFPTSSFYLLPSALLRGVSTTFGGAHRVSDFFLLPSAFCLPPGGLHCLSAFTAFPTPRRASAGRTRGDVHQRFDTSQFYNYCEFVKNITVSVEDDVYRSARVEAAKQNTSVSAVVRNYLGAFARGQAPVLSAEAEDDDRKNRRRLVKLLSECKLDLGYRPSRDMTYEGGRFSRF